MKHSEYQRRWRKRHPQSATVRGVGQRCKGTGIEVDKDYFRGMVCPEVCPVLGYPIKFGTSWCKGSLRNMASFDRKDPEKGYVRGNVQIISFLANTMKWNANRQELVAFANWVLKT